MDKVFTCTKDLSHPISFGFGLRATGYCWTCKESLDFGEVKIISKCKGCNGNGMKMIGRTENPLSGWITNCEICNP